MVRIKMCGITSAIDAEAAADAGVSSIGLVAFESSPRFILPSKVTEIRQALPPWVSITVVAPDLNIASRYDVDVYQLYKMPTVETQTPIIRAIRTGDSIDVEQVLALIGSEAALLFDAYHPHLMGGSGHRIDDSLALRLFTFPCVVPRILAGGLTPDNVASAVELFRPWGVDVSSGIESRPGEKCHKKIREFSLAIARANVRLMETPIVGQRGN